MTRSVECPHCGYEITTYREISEALESGGTCLLCGGKLDLDQLEIADSEWDDEEIAAEGQNAAEAEQDLDAEENLFDGVPDFGDEGEDDSVL